MKEYLRLARIFLQKCNKKGAVATKTVIKWAGMALGNWYHRTTLFNLIGISPILPWCRQSNCC
jgi:hypothetical protein